MSRFAHQRRVWFFEEPVFEEATTTVYLRRVCCDRTGVVVLTPVLPSGLAPDRVTAAQRKLLDDLVTSEKIADYITWYYTPMAREFSRHLKPAVTVFDCMDELSAFAGAPLAMKRNEADLFAHADLVFTGGASLFQAKRKQHPAVYLFPSSVDADHFRKARTKLQPPEDQDTIPEPRLGYAGVIDERMDVELLREAARLRPNWHFVMIGPVVKIDPAILPQGPNLHYLGMKAYSDLPTYFSGWRIGMLPFAINEATKYISPTKTPEYLAAGLGVVSTPITDVVTPYGELGLAAIASNARDFVSVSEELLERLLDDRFIEGADAFLSQSSWDRTWSDMNELIEDSAREGRMGLDLEGAHV